MGPVFEHRLVDALGPVQMRAPVSRNAGPQNVVVTALDHVDGVDLHIAEMRDCRGHSPWPIAERRRRIEPLRAQPDAPRLRVAQ